jgi:aryl-alcohol dehydrogenase-like predicted oxidoreductase
MARSDPRLRAACISSLHSALSRSLDRWAETSARDPGHRRRVLISGERVTVVEVSQTSRQLAGSDVSIPPLGVGTWAWGDRSTWGMGGYDKSLTLSSIEEAWNASIDAGVTLFDTAEGYGRGESERIIGSLLASDAQRAKSVKIATKFMPFPWKVDVRRALMGSLRASLQRLGVQGVDLYQIHGPISFRSHSAMAEALAEAHRLGMTRAVGVSNYSAREMRSIAAELQKRGLALATNQVEFSLLRNDPAVNGLFAACDELGVVPLAYSPIGQGRLTGKYSASNPPPGKRNFSNYPMGIVEKMTSELGRLGEKHGGKTSAQVALNWIMAKGVVPIPGAKNRQQAEQNAGSLGWALDEEDLRTLDALALRGRRSLQGRFWQHG